MVRDPLLIFDLGNVIVRHSEPVLFDNISAACDDPVAARPLLEAVFDMGVGDLLPTRQFFENIRGRIGFERPYEAFESIWCSHFSRDPGMEDMVRSLAARYRLVILSNTNDVHWRFLTGTYDIMKVPHALYTSFELGMEKPSLEIYRHVLQAERRSAEDAIFIDDRVVNVEGAKGAGIHAIHFIDRPTLEQDLAKLGVSAETV